MAEGVEHYEISGYYTAVRFSKELDKIVKKLQKTLDERYLRRQGKQLGFALTPGRRISFIDV